MENKHLEKNKLNAGKKTIKLNEITNEHNEELWYVITKQNKLRLMYMDGRCKI